MIAHTHHSFYQGMTTTIKTLEEIKMTQKELAMAVQKEFDNHSVKEIEALVKNIFLHIGQELVGGGKVQIAGFGTFEVKEREARKGMNPRTGEEIDLPATKRVSFKQSKALKETLNEN